MIRTYKFYNSDYQKIHKFILAFFDRIEFETRDFDISFFEPEFQEIVESHPKIIFQQCKKIYESFFKAWTQAERTEFCQKVRKSNALKDIFEGKVKPTSLSELPNGLKDLISDLFLKLYKNVLFSTKYGSRASHFKDFRKINEELTVCPCCGLSELKTEHDDTIDPYDHYLSKATYPFSAINLYNLVPTCDFCNGLNCKGDKDIVTEAVNGKLLNPFDDTYPGLELRFAVTKESTLIEDTEFQFYPTCKDGREDEILSWRKIYNIDSRYIGLIKGRIGKWYQLYRQMKNKASLSSLPESMRETVIFDFLEAEETLALNFIRRPALEAFLKQSVILRAEMEAKLYSKV